MDKLSKHIPELNSSSGRLRIALYASILLLVTTAYFYVTDQIPTWSIDSQIIIISLGFLVLSLFFSRKPAYQEKYKELAYRKALTHYAMPGTALLLAAIAHAGYMNGPFIPRGWWTILFLVLGWYLLITGAILWIRSAVKFGPDNIALLFVYYPEESYIIDSSIYSILRHPIYAGAICVCVGLALLNGNANSIASAIFVPLFFTGWIRLVEEKELIQRYGKSYLDYRKLTPAFFPHLSSIRKFFIFLITGK
jgi:protein-S-isoprenylcysteine O-methyltransferase Ste14